MSNFILHNLNIKKHTYKEKQGKQYLTMDRIGKLMKKLWLGDLTS